MSVVKLPVDKGFYICLLLLGLTGCVQRHTEAEVARWHGFKESERRPEFEKRPSDRCYSHPSPSCIGPPACGFIVSCYDLNAETDVNYEVVP